jgi:hypothetical protein
MNVTERLRNALNRQAAAKAELDEAKRELLEAGAEILECQEEIRTGQPAAPLLNLIEEKAAAAADRPGPRPPADFAGRRGQPVSHADREPVRVERGGKR